jgi:hypothetical protein
VGELTVVLPRRVGVRVTARHGIGEIEADGLRQDGDTYVNSAYGSTHGTVNVTVEQGVGTIVLEQAGHIVELSGTVRG